MRCRHCDFPLSPTNTTKSCPRCHMPVAAGGTGKYVAFDEQQSFPSMPQTAFPQPGQMWQQSVTPPPTPTQVATRLYEGASFSPFTPFTPFTPITPFTPQESHLRSQDTRTTRKLPSNSNLGFILAGLCVVTGGLLLILVFFLAAGLPAAGTQTQAVTKGVPTAAVTHHHATPTPVVTPPAVTPSPTTPVGAFPGQQYITNPRTASAVNSSTAQVIQAATTFKVGQRVYVTFAIHPNGQDGAVCLLWYTNASVFSNFEFAVTPGSTVAYSYTFAPHVGPSYVEIFWASNVSCNDKMLAQRVSFSVIN